MAIWTSSGSPTFNADGSCTINSTGSDLISGPPALLTASQGWFATRLKMGFASGAAPTAFPKAFYYNIASSGYIHGIWDNAASNWRIQRFNGTSGPGTLDVADTFASGDNRTVIWKWDASNVYFSLNGAAFTSAAGGTVPVAAPAALYIGSDTGVANWIASDMYWCCGGTGTLANVDAATLHAYGDNDPSEWPSFGTPTFLWRAQNLSYFTNGIGISDPVTIGDNGSAAGATTIALTTTATVPANSKIFIVVVHIGSGVTLTSVSDGTNTYRIDREYDPVDFGYMAIVTADTSSALASGSTITATFSGSATSRQICGAYSTGVQTGDVDYGLVEAHPTTAVWSSGATTVNAGDILIGASCNFISGYTDTPSGGNTELHDFAIGGNSATTTMYQIPVSTGAIAASGTWSGGDADIAMAIAYPAASLQLANTFEGGVDEDDITAGNSGGASGDAFTSVTIGSGNTFKFDTAQVMHGSFSARLFLDTTAAATFFTWTQDSLATTFGRFYFYLEDLPTAAYRPLRLRNGATNQGFIEITAAGKVRILNAAATSVAVQTGTLSPDTWYRIEYSFTQGASGSGELRLYLGDDTSVIETLGPVTSSFGTLNFDTVHYGNTGNTQTTARTLWFDDLVAGATDWPGPLVVAAEKQTYYAYRRRSYR